MKKYRNYPIILCCFVIFGCSALSPSIEPTKTPSHNEIPTDMLEITKQWTITPTITKSVTPNPTQLSYSMVEIGETTEDLASILAREAQNAKELSQAPYIQIYGDWCPPCQALKRSMTDERMIDAYRGTYIILVNIDVWRDQLPKTGIYVNGVPAIFELTYEGKPTGRFITGAAWGEDIPENMAPPLDAFFHPE